MTGEKPASTDRRNRGTVDFSDGDPISSRYVGPAQLTIFLGCAFVGVGYLFSTRIDIVKVLGILAFALVGITSMWARRLNQEAPTKVLVVGFWLVSSYLVARYAGIHSVIVIIYPLIAVLSGWMLGMRWLAGLTAVSVAFLFAIGTMEYVGAFQPSPRIDTMLVTFIVIAVLMGAAAFTCDIYSSFAARNDHIRNLAYFDQLTGLPNRAQLLDRLDQTIAASSRDQHFAALVCIDLDNFKTLNYTLGHDHGDMLLKQVGDRLKGCTRTADTLARSGGDEFMVILPNLGTSRKIAAREAELIARKILDTLAEPYQLGSVSHRNTTSIGIVLSRGDEASVDDLMKRADLAMYKSKVSGRDMLRFFDPTLESEAAELALLEAELRAAVEQQQFVLHYQPLVAGEKKVIGAEALLRWQHPQRGIVSPAVFIGLAEETGLIQRIGHWVLETACRQLVDWAAHPVLEKLTIAVNVSAHQFHQDDFVDQVLDLLEKTGANPKRLKLELTESLLVENIDGIIGKMATLKKMGVGFSLDDFGTGYSSLSYLKKLPLGHLKIDQSFVRDVLTDPNDAAIARTIIALAWNLGMGVIAEGVETREQLEFLSSSGCDICQGYYFSRPVPIEEFETFVKQY